MFVLLLLSILVVVVVVRPLAAAILLGAVLAAVAWPVQRRLTRALRGRSSLAAGLVVVGLLLLVLVPLVAMSTFLVQQAIEAVAFVQDVLRSGGVDRLVALLPDALEGPARQALATLESPLSRLAQGVAGVASTVAATLAATGTAAFQTAMALVALFFFLSHKDEVITWLDDVSPLEASQTRELLEEVHRVSVSIIRSTVLTAGVQTVVATVGYWIVGVPFWLFFAGLTFFVALIPAVGAAAACLAVAGLLLLVGKPVGALFLAAWGLIVVGLSDNVVKPLLMRHGIRMNGVVVLFALLGGLGAFGPIGLIVGPLAVAVFVAVLRIWRRDYGDGGGITVPTGS